MGWPHFKGMQLSECYFYVLNSEQQVISGHKKTGLFIFTGKSKN